VRDRTARCHGLPALALVRSAAPHDGPAPGAADPAHGGADLRDAGRAPGGRRLARAGEGVLRPRNDRCLTSGPMRRIALLLPGLLMLLAPASASATSHFAYDIPKLV